MSHPPDDATLLDALRVRLAEPVPPDVIAAAREALRWRDPDAALAILVADTMAAATPAGIRGPGSEVFTFETERVTIEVEASQLGHELHLAGQLAPAMAARVRIDQPGGGTVVPADELGRFAARGLRLAMWRLAVLVDDDVPINTEWVL